jgi:di/tripeptidase
MLEEILKIPTFYGREELLTEYVVEFAAKHDIKCSKDAKGNVYLIKGNLDADEHYPCVVAHLDTVHTDQEQLVDSRGRIELKESYASGKRKLKGMDPLRKVPTGIGGDNKCGVYIALKMMLEFEVIKGAFFVEEEIGMKGSKVADDSFFKDVGYAIQFDAPTRNWFSARLMGVKLWNDVFFNDLFPLLEKFGVDNITEADPFTDVLQIRKKYGLCCAVFPTGYYNQHSKDEYVIPEETEECLLLGLETVGLLGRKRYSI